MKVKICGITNLEIALAAVEAGADALGFVFAESRRRVTPEQARAIIEQLPPFINTVGVFVNEDLEELCRIADFCRLDTLQLHGEETPEYLRQANRPVLKAIKVASEQDLEQMEQYQGLARGFLLDTLVAGQSGGTGLTFPWPLAKTASQYGPVIVAGGLNPDNIYQALAAAEPFGVDVSSGVETDGKKDITKIRTFIERVRGYRHG